MIFLFGFFFLSSLLVGRRVLLATVHSDRGRRGDPLADEVSISWRMET